MWISLQFASKLYKSLQVSSSLFKTSKEFIEEELIKAVKEFDDILVGEFKAYQSREQINAEVLLKAAEKKSKMVVKEKLEKVEIIPPRLSRVIL